MGKDHLYIFDFLRIMCAASLLLYHYSFRSVFVDGKKVHLFPIIDNLTRYGYLGIIVFFIISGFVILHSALNKPAITFLVSRIDRLYPIYFISASLTVLTILISGGNYSLYAYLMNLTMMNDYFNVPDIDDVYWTLHTELKFYFFVFLLVMTKQIKNYHIWIPAWLAVTGIYLLFDQPYFMGLLITPFYSSYLISGIIFYLIYRNLADWKYYAYLFLSLLVSLIHSIKQVDNFIRDPSLTDKIVTPLLVALIYLVFYLISVKKLSMKKKLNLVFFGAATYPLYLLHARIGKPLMDWILPHTSRYVSLMAVSFLMVVLSCLIIKLTEIWYSSQIRGTLLSLHLGRIPRKQKTILVPIRGASLANETTSDVIRKGTDD